MEFDPENDPNEAFECFHDAIRDGNIEDENEKTDFIKKTVCDKLNAIGNCDGLRTYLLYQAIVKICMVYLERI